MACTDTLSVDRLKAPKEWLQSTTPWHLLEGSMKPLNQITQLIASLSPEAVMTLLTDSVEGKESLIDHLDLPSSDLQKQFVLACDQFEREDFRGAKESLAPLCFLNPMHQELWMLFGTIHMTEDQHHLALQSYLIASLLDPTDPLPHLFAGACFVNLEDFSEATRALKLAIELSTPSKGALEHQKVVGEAQNLLSSLK